jgi:amidase
MAGLDDYERYDAVSLAALVRAGEVHPSELVEAAIARIDARNPALNAVIVPMYEQARAAAAAALPDGPLRGVPMLLKDLLATVQGVPTSQGNRVLRRIPAPHDSELVRRLRAAGVVLLGKTSTSEFGLTPYTEPEAFGPTRNPWDPSRTPGGSSGGSAAAVAAGMVPIASGGDGGGSIRIPASCCGLFGLKVSRGRTPTGPDFGELWHGLGNEHALTRSVRDSAVLLDATAGEDAGAPYAAPRAPASFLEEVGREPGRLRIAFTARPLFGAASTPVHEDCREGLARAVALLGELGHETAEDAPAVDGEACARDFLAILAAQTRVAIEEAARFARRRVSAGDFEAATYALGLLGRAGRASEYAGAAERLQRAARVAGAFFTRYDMLLTPTLAQPPLPIGALQPGPAERAAMRVVNALGAGWLLRLAGTAETLASKTFAWMPYTALFNATGQPAMSVPLHWNAAGLPIGMQFVGRFGDEATLLRLAGQLECARPWAHRRPSVASSLVSK